MGKQDPGSLQRNIEEWLEADEQLLGFTLGSEQGQFFETIIALTNRAIRLGSPTGGSTHHLSTVRAVGWSGLWARLNISISEPRQRLVFAVNGKEWKTRAQKLAESWNALGIPN